MSGCELVEVRNVADAVGLVLSKRSDTMRRQARKRYLQVVERKWWTWSGSNRRPLPCHGSALPAAPQAHLVERRNFPKLIFTHWKAIVKPNSRRPQSIPS